MVVTSGIIVSNSRNNLLFSAEVCCCDEFYNYYGLLDAKGNSRTKTDRDFLTNRRSWLVAKNYF